MANEYHYSVSLSILHPTVDPTAITALLAHLHPTQEVMVGTEMCRKDGKPMVPKRVAKQSHWEAQLHDEKRLYSGNRPMSEFLLDHLNELEKHRESLAQLRTEGRLAF